MDMDSPLPDPFVGATSDEEIRLMTRNIIDNYPGPNTYNESVGSLEHWVCAYLVHHGYPASAQAFAASTGLTISEDIESVRGRCRIKDLIKGGQTGEAIKLTFALYPGVLESKPNLFFMLKCRQFIDMVCDLNTNGYFKDINSPFRPPKIHKNNNTIELNGSVQHRKSFRSPELNGHDEDDLMNGLPTSESDSDCDRDPCFKECDSRRQMRLQKGFKAAQFSIERMLTFGKNLNELSKELIQKDIVTEENKKLLKDAFSLLAYPNPWECTLNCLLSRDSKEKVAEILNADILEFLSKPKRSPLDTLFKHAGLVLQELFRESRLQPVTTNDVLFK